MQEGGVRLRPGPLRRARYRPSVQRDGFEEYAGRLADWAAAADGVLGLVLLGSTAATTHQPDEWSDHDFFVIAEQRVAEPLRASTAWLPARDAAVVLHERDTAHGAWVVFSDGHLLEYIAMLPQEPRPDEGIVPWRKWKQMHEATRSQP